MPKTVLLRTEYRALSELLRLRVKGNPKRHDEDLIRLSLIEHGFVQPVMVDEGANLLGAGHGRTKTLAKMKEAGEPAPKYIDDRGMGEWFVPTVAGVKFESKEQLRRFIVVDNQSVLSQGFDNPLLAKFLSGITDLAGTGISDDDLVRFMAQAGTAAKGNGDPDAAVARPKKPKAKLGQLWILGEHRLLCGDSTKKSDVARLMDGQKAVLCASDAPYGVDYVEVKGLKKTWDEGIENDNLPPDKLRELLDKVFALAPLMPRAAVYQWHPSGELNEVFRAAMVAAGWLIHRQIVWAKPNFVMTRSGMYHWSHETCFYGWQKGKIPPWYGEKNQRSVWDIAMDEGKTVHPTQKPVEIFERPMLNHTAPGQICYEPFSGSGSQIIAGEKQSRRVFAMELDPRWVDAVIERWQTFSGLKARLA